MDWVGGFHILGPGTRPNPPEIDPRPNPSESGIRFCGVKNAHIECKILQKLSLRGCSESTRIHPNPTPHRIRPNPETPSEHMDSARQVNTRSFIPLSLR